MNIEKLFSTKERMKILTHIVDDYEQEHRITEVARTLGLSKATVFSYFKLLQRYGMLSRKNRHFQVNLNSFTKQVKVLLNLGRLNITPLTKLRPLGIGLYGSWADGTNTKGSDIDVWIHFQKHPGELAIAKAQGILARSIGYEVNILVIDNERLKRIRKDETFYHSLLFRSIVLYGDLLEA